MQESVFRKKLEAIQDEKFTAYKEVADKTVALLQSGSSTAFEEIYDGFQRYKKIELEEDQFVLNNAPTGYSTLTHTLFSTKNIKDIYWKLPDDLKSLWNANPDLKTWGDHYT